MYKKRFSLQLFIVMVLMLASLFPFYIMLSGSFKPSMSFFIVPMDLNPFQNISIKNYAALIRKVDIFGSFRNSIYISGLITVITVAVAAPGGYVFAKKHFAGKHVLFVAMMATMMLPRQLLMVPNFMIANSLGLVNKLTGVVLTSINAAYGIFLCRQYMMSLMDGIIEAAVIDGCGEFGVFTRIVIPLSRPVFGALAIFTFIISWNDFIWHNIMLTSKSNRTIPLALSYLIGLTEGVSTIGLQLAGAAVSVVPIFLVFLLFQRYFISGLSSGAIKG